MISIHSNGNIFFFFYLLIALLVQNSLAFIENIKGNSIHLNYIDKAKGKIQSTQHQPRSFLRSQNEESTIDALVNGRSNYQIDLKSAKEILTEQNSSITGLYYLPSCPFCKQVLKVYEDLDQNANIPLKHLKETNPESGQLYLQELLSITPNNKQVPALEIDNKYILRESSNIITLLNEISTKDSSQNKSTTSAKLNSITAQINSEPKSSELISEDVSPSHELQNQNSIDENDCNYQSDTPYQAHPSVANTIKEREINETNSESTNLSNRMTLNSSNIPASPPDSLNSANKNDLMISRMIFVGNITWEAVAEDLEKCMALVGNVTDVSFIYNRFGRHKGCAVVTYNSSEEASEAIKILNNTYFKGRKINVQAYARFPRSSLPHSQHSREITKYSQQNQYYREPYRHSGNQSQYHSNNLNRFTTDLQPGHIADSVIFVWNLPNEFLKNDLETLFNNVGYVRQTHIVPLHEAQSNRLGIVMFSSEQDALRAQRRYDKKTIQGHNIEISMGNPFHNFRHYNRPPYTPNRNRFTRNFPSTMQSNKPIENHFDRAIVDPGIEQIVDSIVPR